MDMLGDVADMTGDAANVIVLTGAGISQASGIPTFRGVGGLWGDPGLVAAHNVDALPNSLPVLWKTWGPLRAQVADTAPNAAHDAVAALDDLVSGSVTVVTQNVDGLHQRAGSATVSELHGNLFRSRCMSCDAEYPDTEVPMGVPISPCCGAPARPDVVLFGEAPSLAAERTAKLACRKADVLLVVGTSGKVSTATGFLRYAVDYGAATVLVNQEPWDDAGWRFGATLLGSAEEQLPLIVERVRKNRSPRIP